MDEADPSELRARAERYRRLMQNITDPSTLDALTELAADCDARANEAEMQERAQQRSNSRR